MRLVSMVRHAAPKFDPHSRIAAIPNLQLVLDEAKALIDSIPQWTKGKDYHGVRTHKRHCQGPAWYSRTR